MLVYCLNFQNIHSLNCHTRRYLVCDIFSPPQGVENVFHDNNDNKAFLNELARLVGHSHLLTIPQKRPAIARASVLVRATRCCRFPWLTTGIVAGAESLRHADKIILMQAANTGLTEGSTPTVTIMIAIS